MSAGIPIDLDVRPFSRSNVTDLNLNGSLVGFHNENGLLIGPNTDEL